MLKTNLLFIAIAILLALALAFYQYLFKNKEKSQLKYWLFTLRFFTFFLIGFLLINPTFYSKTYTIQKPTLAVLVDNSLSIKDTNYVSNVVKHIKGNTKISNKYEVNYYKFGNQLGSLDSLSFSEDNTNISNALLEIKKLYKKNVATVLITDGNITQGTNPLNINFKNEIYPLIVGDTTKQEDIFVSKVNVNKQVYLKNNFPIEVFITYYGNKAVSKKVSIFYNKKKIAQQNVKLNTKQNSKSLSFNLKAEAEGIQYYRVEVEPLEKEKNTKNNHKNFSINVINKTIKIAVVHEVTHPDLAFLKRTLKENKKFKTSFFKVESSNLKINDYQLFILYQPTDKFKKITDKINAHKLNYFIITGLQTNWTYVNQLQNLFHKAPANVFEKIQPKLNLNYTPYLIDKINFNNYPPVENSFGNITFKTLPNVLLYQKIKGITTKQPLMASVSYNSQKTGVFFGENLWKWRVEHFRKNNSFEKLDVFFTHFIEYLSSKTKQQQLSVYTKPFFYTNEQVTFNALYLGEDLKYDNRAKIQLVIYQNKKEIIKQPFYLEGNSYKTSISNLKSGTYSYKVLVENANQLKTGSFKILPYNLEEQFTYSNFTDLQILATQSNGKLYFQNTEKKLIEQLITSKKNKPIQLEKVKPTTLINQKIILFILLFLLGLEWFVRKYFGKI